MASDGPSLLVPRRSGARLSEHQVVIKGRFAFPANRQVNLDRSTLPSRLKMIVVKYLFGVNRKLVI
ncbi:MAG TPA: hypothetical protein DDW68_08705 [Verrucomicrobiales bacterium]|nr:hypothetical protein [Verrucomicrobiales bacterium]